MSGLSKSVSLRIVTDAGNAKSTLDDIMAKADDINGKKSSLTVKVNDGTAKAELDEITAKADALGIKDIRFRVRADTSSADSDLKKTKGDADSLSKSLKDAAVSFTGFDGAVDAASSDGSKFSLAMAALNLSTGLLEPAMAGLIVVVGGLSSGLVAAGAGLGVFGLAAYGAIDQVENANTAGTKLKGTLGELQTSLGGVTKEYDNWVNQSANGVASVLVPALKMVPELLQDATQFLAPVEAGLKEVISEFSAGMKSSFVTGLIHDLAQNAGPAIEKLAKAMGDVVLGIGGILKAFMPMAQTMLSGLDDLTAKFAKWGETLSGHSGFQQLMTMAKQQGPEVISVLKNIGSVIVKVIGDMAGMSSFSNSGLLLKALLPISEILNKIASNKAFVTLALYGYMAYGVFSKFKGMMQLVEGGIKAVSMATKVWSAAQFLLDSAMDASPIGVIVVAVAALATGIVLLSTHCKAFRDFWIDAWKDIKTAFSAVWNFIKAQWPLLAGILLGPIALAAGEIIQHWKSIESGFKSAWNAITSAFHSAISAISSGISSMASSVLSRVRAIPGEIGSALSDLGSILYDAGYNAMVGLWNGINAMAGRLISYVENIASSIGHAFMGILGIHSPSTVFHGFGQNIVQGLVEGIETSHGLATAAVGRLGQSVTDGMRVSVPGAQRAAVGPTGGAGPVINVTVQGLVGDAGGTGREIAQALNTYLRQTGQGQLVGA